MAYRTSTRLADDRELIYFDTVPIARGELRDRRDLPRIQVGSQARWDPMFAEYNVIAGHRQDRTFLPPADECPLCPSTAVRSTEIPARAYDVVVFENRFPSFALSAEPSGLEEHLAFESIPGRGRCEVVVYSSSHDGSIPALPPERMRLVIDAWVDRTRALSDMPGIAYVFCFENYGEQIGVTLSHPHGQIYGYPFVPARFAVAQRSAEEHLEFTDECLQCSQLAAELDAGLRIVAEGQHWVAYVPFAARWPYQLRVVPRACVPDLTALDDAQRDDLALMYRDVIGRFQSLFPGRTPYIAGWQQAPVHRRAGWHLAAEMFTVRRSAGKLKFLAGSESGAASWINDVAPELAAHALRAAVTQEPARTESIHG